MVKPSPRGSGRPSQKIEVLDILTNEITEYACMGAAGFSTYTLKCL